MGNKIESIIAEFDIPGFSNISMIGDNEAVHNIDDKYILKRTAYFDQCKKSIELSNQLSQKDISVAKFIPLKNGLFYFQDEDFYYSLTHKINGQPMNVDKGDYILNAKHIGETAASLTLALENCECELCPDMDCIEILNDWVKFEIKKESLPVSKEMLDYLDSFEPLYRKLPRQIIHKDLNGGNILFDENMKFQGFIDFDIAEINARAYDISYLLQCPFGCSNADKEHEIKQYIFESYNKIVCLTDEEKQAIPYFFAYIGIMLSAWFAKCGLKDLALSCAKGTGWSFENKHLFVC